MLKYPLLVVFILLVLFILGVGVGFIGIKYPVVIEDQPFKNPIKVSKVIELPEGQGLEFELEDGRVLYFTDSVPKDFEEDLARSGNEIDLRLNDTGKATVLIRHSGWICGTPWAQPLRVPLIAETVYKNYLYSLGTAVIFKRQRAN